jgi:hypothetical protein
MSQKIDLAPAHRRKIAKRVRTHELHVVAIESVFSAEPM